MRNPFGHRINDPLPSLTLPVYEGWAGRAIRLGLSGLFFGILSAALALGLMAMDRKPQDPLLVEVRWTLLGFPIALLMAGGMSGACLAFLAAVGGDKRWRGGFASGAVSGALGLLIGGTVGDLAAFFILQGLPDHSRLEIVVSGAFRQGVILPHGDTFYWILAQALGSTVAAALIWALVGMVSGSYMRPSGVSLWLMIAWLEACAGLICMSVSCSSPDSHFPRVAAGAVAGGLLGMVWRKDPEKWDGWPPLLT